MRFTNSEGQNGSQAVIQVAMICILVLVVLYSYWHPDIYLRRTIGLSAMQPAKTSILVAGMSESF